MPRKPITEATINNYIRDNQLNVTFHCLSIKKDKSGRSRTWIEYQCSCGENYSKDWTNFKKSILCKTCGREKANESSKKYTLEFVSQVLSDKNFELVGNYVNSGASFTYRCLICGNTAKTNFGNVLTGRQCKKCAGMKKKTTEEFKEEVFNLVNDEYEVLGEYLTAHEKIKIKHNKCNHIYYVSPHLFLMNRRCPKCNTSKGESRIIDFLMNHDIKFESQYRFIDCRNKIPLPFDFAIFNNEKLIFLIEFDGIQHYEASNWWGEDVFIKLQKHDQIKTDYCNKNKIKLLRIPYYQINKIDNILTRELKEVGLY